MPQLLQRGLMNGKTDFVRRWDDAIVNQQIAELERLLAVLPVSVDGKWHTFFLHGPIKAQIEVLKIGKMKDRYSNESESDSALWAMQWLYLSVPGLCDYLEGLKPEDISAEWLDFEPLAVA
jgi:hypothetical protein